MKFHIPIQTETRIFELVLVPGLVGDRWKMVGAFDHLIAPAVHDYEPRYASEA